MAITIRRLFGTFVLLALLVGCASTKRGDLVVRVTDARHGLPISVSFYVEHLPDDVFFALLAGTDGEKDLDGTGPGARRLTLAPGRYLIRVRQFECGEKVYFTSSSTPTPVQIHAGRTQRVDLKFDPHDVQAEVSFDNPAGTPCLE